MTTAEHVATKIYQRIGVNLAWISCPMTQPVSEIDPACVAPDALTGIHLNIVPDLTEGPRVGKYAVGYAIPTPPPQRGTLANVSYARACRQLPDTLGLTVGQLLGHVVAHEIGHLLLGTNSHSASGLMSAGWTAWELLLAAHMKLIFSDEQAVRIRDDVWARMQVQATAQLRQPARD
jgi:hypothetical protein